MVWGFGLSFEVQGLGVRTEGLGFGVEGAGFQDSGFRGLCCAFRVSG